MTLRIISNHMYVLSLSLNPKKREEKKEELLYVKLIDDIL